MRTLALDLGTKRIGLAISDPTGLFASPLMVIQRVGIRKDIERIVAEAKNHAVGLILVGLPISMDGVERDQAHNTRIFCARLKESTDITIDVWDERLTTVEADRRMIEIGLPARKRQEKRDAFAAAIMLQAYLASKIPTDQHSPTQDTTPWKKRSAPFMEKSDPDID